MVEAEFDRYADSYRDQHQSSVAFGGFELDYFARYKAQIARRCCDEASQEPERIMDFGSGLGNALPPLREAFPDAFIECVDVSKESLAQCSRLNIENTATTAYDGQTLPYADATFDLIFTACVFHHIPEADHVRLLSEIRRCLKPGGRFVLFEHNPLNPLTQLAVARCPFDDDAVLIGSREMKRRLRQVGFGTVTSRFRLFFPGFLSALRGLEDYMEMLPLGGQYYLNADV